MGISAMCAAMSSKALLMVAAALVMAVSVSAQPGPWPAEDGTDLSCTVMLWGEQDYLWNVTDTREENGTVHRNFTSHCMQGVKLARRRCGGKSINFVPTHFWKWHDAETFEPLRVCYKTNFGDDQVPVTCQDFVDWYPQNVSRSHDMIWRFYKGMKGCFITAIWEGFTEIKITPHLDDGTGGGGWRNTLGLDPWKKLEGYSYVDIMLWPIAQALNESMTDTNTSGKIKVMLTLQGEMNYALAAFPNEWLGVMNTIREWIYMPNGTAHLLKVGVSLNYNKLCGFYCNGSPTLAGSDTPLNIEGYKALLQQVDYLGISNYPSLSESMGTDNWNFEGPIAALDEEMRTGFGFSLQELMDYKEGKEFHLSEFAVGGGTSQCGCQTGTDRAAVADTTFFGLFGTYGKFDDPWQNPDLHDFQVQFYQRAIRWLANRGGPTYRVDGAFLWSMSSWDVAGIYWTSYREYSEWQDQASNTSDTNPAPSGTYYKPDITVHIKNWNDNRMQP